MNKEILISIKPEHLIDILNGTKTLELRKTVPKDYKGWVNIYCTKSKPYLGKNHDGNIGLYNIPAFGHFNKSGDLNGKVVARFWFDEYQTLEIDWDLEISTIKISHEKLLEKSCVDYNTLNNMFMNENGDVFGYAWHIKKLEIFDEPMELKDFGVKRAPQSYQFVYVKELKL